MDNTIENNTSDSENPDNVQTNILDERLINELARVSHLDKVQAYHLAAMANTAGSVAELDSLIHVLTMKQRESGWNKNTGIAVLNYVSKTISLTFAFILALYWYLYQQSQNKKEEMAEKKIIDIRFLTLLFSILLFVIDISCFAGQRVLERKNTNEFESKKHFLSMLIPIMKREISVESCLSAPDNLVYASIPTRVIIHDSDSRRVSIASSREPLRPSPPVSVYRALLTRVSHWLE
ncbi:hypothetical protein R9D66_004262 [Citrobacter amalonaticus]|nr:hypothetical protein [Citrobacter amalonaticus]